MYSKIDDDFHAFLTEGARFVGEPGIPELMDMNNTQVPKRLIRYTDLSKETDYHGYVHFYIHDNKFSSLLTLIKRKLPLLQKCDGVISIDFSMLIGQSKCLQQTNVYFNRAFCFYLQKQGIPVIPNIRWSDESSYSYCFLGVPQNSIVAISTHGCIRRKADKARFKHGLIAMLETLHPRTVIVHGYMPNAIFGDLKDKVQFVRYPNHFELHKKQGRK